MASFRVMGSDGGKKFSIPYIYACRYASGNLNLKPVAIFDVSKYSKVTIETLKTVPANWSYVRNFIYKDSTLLNSYSSAVTESNKVIDVSGCNTLYFYINVINTISSDNGGFELTNIKFE